ncbi:MAG: hypothetical protein HKL90_10750 [Elusimicrobia bacterium]|nr:hypothetical protein [Elusimicrobiota bacterium]
MAITIGPVDGIGDVSASKPPRQGIVQPPGGPPPLPEAVVEMLDWAGFQHVQRRVLEPLAPNRQIVMPVNSDKPSTVTVLEHNLSYNEQTEKWDGFCRFHRSVAEAQTPESAGARTGTAHSFIINPASPDGFAPSTRFLVYGVEKSAQDLAASLLHFVITPVLMINDNGSWSAVTTPVNLAQKKKTILMIHGFFSKVDEAFKDVDYSLPNSTPDDVLLGFNHETLAHSPADNATQLIDLLNKWLIFPSVKTTLDVICHSRGGLVARAFLSAVSSGPQWNIGELSTYGSPNQGTTLAVRALDLLNVGMNAAIRGLLPQASGDFSRLLVAAVDNAALPGVVAMTPANVAALPPIAFKPPSAICVQAAYAPCSWSARLLNYLYGIAAFNGNPNDLIVDLPYMSLNGQTQVVQEVHTHFEYFEKGKYGYTPF